MRARVRDLLLLITTLVLLVSTSNVLTLCVHDDHVGFEASWQTCCDTAPCCESAALPESHDTTFRTHDGCRDYVLALDIDWVPSEVSHDSSAPWTSAIQPPAPAVYRLLCAWKAPTAAPSRGPPPDRSLRTVILRC